MRSSVYRNSSGWTLTAKEPDAAPSARSGMQYRSFGKTGMLLSEVGFGALQIGQSYGTVDRSESLSALARDEELGCNLVDTGGRYGDSELVLGQFLNGRRSKWHVATKYSGQPEGLEATIEQQLVRLWGRRDRFLPNPLGPIPGGRMSFTRRCIGSRKPAKRVSLAYRSIASRTSTSF